MLTETERARLHALNADHLRRMIQEESQFSAQGLQPLLDAQDRLSREHLVGAMRGAELRFEMFAKDKWVLELGPGRNPDQRYLMRAFHAEEWRGVDIVPENARALGEECLAIAIEDLPEDWNGMFDVVYSRHVLEHVIDPDRALAAIRRVLSPCGIVGSVTPHQPDTEPAHVTQLPLELWPAIYSRQGLDVVYGEVKHFRVEESHIVAIRSDWPR